MLNDRDRGEIGNNPDQYSSSTPAYSFSSASWQERRYGKHVRHLRLDNDVDEGNVRARYEDGMLELTLPKVEAVQPKRIPVKVH